MEPRVIVITGGTSGVGYSLARDIASVGTRVFVVGHNTERGLQAQESLRAATGNRAIEFLQADLSDPSELRRLSKEIHERTDRLDLFSYNAGTFSTARQTTDTGTERTFAVNYLGFYGLSVLLAPLLVNAAPSRIVSVSGGPRVMARARLDFNDLQMESGYNGLAAAVRSALAKVLCTMKLARELKSTGVTANTYHPGVVRSGIGGQLPPALRPVFAVANLLLSRRTRTGIYAATDPDLRDTTGAFLAGGREVEFHSFHHSEADADLLIAQSSALTGIPWEFPAAASAGTAGGAGA